MQNRKDVHSNCDWVSDLADLCLSGQLPPLPMAEACNGLDLPDVELDALCEAIFANLDAR